MTSFLAPSADEQALYEGTKLLFRSSQEPVESCQRHALAAVRSSELCTQWNDSESTLRKQVMAVLKTEHLQGVSIFDTYREAKAWGHKEKSLSTSLLVLVAPDKVTFEQAFQIGTECVQVIRACGFKDVEVDVLEGEYTGRNRNVLNDEPVLQHFGTYRDNRFVSTQHVGASISALAHLTAGGTKGITVKLTYPDQTVKYAFVTCRHVVYDDSMQHNAAFRHIPDGPRKEIIQPSNEVLQQVINMYEFEMLNLQKSLPGIRKIVHDQHQKECDDEQERLEEASEPDTAALAALALRRNQPPVDKKADETQKEIDTIKSKLPELRSWAADPETRVIGHVLLAPSQGTVCHNIQLNEQVEKVKHLRDYAVVELYQDAYAKPLKKLGNLIPGADHGNSLIKHVIASEGVLDFRSSQSPDIMVHDHVRGTFEPKGVYKVSELSKLGCKRPWLERSKRAHEDTGLLVATYGATSGFTVGFINGARMIVRQLSNPDAARAQKADPKMTDEEKAAPTHVAHMKTYDSDELCAVRPRCDGLRRGHKMDKFTAKGDSGSAVFDAITGKWVGMVTGGYEAGKLWENADKVKDLWLGNIDVTIITPFEWLLKDIEQELGCKAEIV